MTGRAALLLLADSQCLFRPAQLMPLRRHLDNHAAGRRLTAAYLGAANGHQRDFFDLACAALEGWSNAGVTCHWVRSEQTLPPHPVDLTILAGGRVRAGWDFLSRPPVRQWLENQYRREASVILGVSAGAIHLASGCDPEEPAPVAQTCLGWAPFFVAAHEEARQWPSRACWRASHSRLRFCGLPFGGGLWVGPDGETPVGTGVVWDVPG